MNAAEIIKELLEYDSEREWFEFKVNWFEADELGEYISALSNGAAMAGRKYAYLLWGVDDKTHEIVGTDFNCNRDVKREPLKHYLARQLSPDVNFVFEDVFVGNKKLTLLTIPASKTVPVSYARERYIRIGSRKENLRKYPEKESFLFEVLRHGFPTIENTPSQYQDLTFEQLLIYYGAKGIKLNPDTFKKNLSFYTEDGKYNMLAQLLSDDSHMQIRVAIFSGKTKADGMYSVREFGNQCLLYSLDEVLRYGDVLDVIQADERDRVVERKEVPLFENEAFREAVINAFVHNKWVGGNEPMITVFSDRIEILSRGSLAPEQTMEGFFAGESVPVNRKLSEIFLRLHISEKTGRGVPRITERYGREAFEFRENSIAVTIPFNRINVMGDKENKKTIDKTGNRNAVRKKRKETELNGTQMKILAEIRKDPSITKARIQEKTGVGKTTVDNGISALKQSGYIERVGSKKTGHWNVLK